jgi:hypothetical protein
MIRLGPGHHGFVRESVFLRQPDHFRLRRNWSYRRWPKDRGRGLPRAGRAAAQ